MGDVVAGTAVPERKENVELKIQVLDETNSVVFEEKISVPDEIPYAPDRPQSGPIGLVGLKTSIDYVLFANSPANTQHQAAKLSTATELLKRIADKTEEGPTGDPQWWREYFLFTGQHMILIEEGWTSADCKDSLADEEVEILDEVNAPA
jgi:hypothetical protein